MLREKWYFPGESDSALVIKKDSQTAIWSGSGVSKSITGKWQKLGKNKYRLSTVEHYEDGTKSPVFDHCFEVKKITNHHKRYLVLINCEKYDGKLDEPKTAYSARFNKPLSKKTAYSAKAKKAIEKKGLYLTQDDLKRLSIPEDTKIIDYSITNVNEELSCVTYNLTNKQSVNKYHDNLDIDYGDD